MIYKIEHKEWNGERGNCIATPDFLYRVGKIVEGGNTLIKAIDYFLIDNISYYVVYSSQIKRNIQTHKG